MPTLRLRPAGRGARGDVDPFDRAALPDPHRAAAPPLLAGRGGAAARAVRRDAALGRHAEAVLWTHVSIDVPGFTGSTEIELPVPAPTTSRSPRRSISTRSTTARSRCSFCSAARSSPRARRASASARCPWHKDATYRLPVRVWRELMDLYFPNSGWLRLQRETLDALLRFKARRALATWDEVVERCCSAEAGETRAMTLRARPPDRRRGALRGLRAVSRTAPRRGRTSCAGSSACSRRAHGARPAAASMVDADRVPGRARRTRRASSARSASCTRSSAASKKPMPAAAFRPVESLDVGEQLWTTWDEGVEREVDFDMALPPTQRRRSAACRSSSRPARASRTIRDRRR